MSKLDNREQTTVLLIDDDSSVHDLIDFHLEGVVDRILHAHHPYAGLAKATQERPDVILLDVNMPNMDGFQVCRQLKDSDQTRDIPVLFLTVDDSVHYIARALDIGGSDYVVKPFQTVELQARVRAALRNRLLIEMLRKHARMDALTGLKNRGALEDALLQAAAGFERNGRPYAVLILDVDHFKKVNDTHGHGRGDEVLRRLGTVIINQCRPTDTAARYGGEEFVIILPEEDEAGARSFAERLLHAVRDMRVEGTDGVISCTCSAGLTMVNPELDTEGAIDRADQALYQAKKGGRDQLVIFDGVPLAPLKT